MSQSADKIARKYGGAAAVNPDEIAGKYGGTIVSTSVAPAAPQSQPSGPDNRSVGNVRQDQAASVLEELGLRGPAEWALTKAGILPQKAELPQPPDSRGAGRLALDNTKKFLDMIGGVVLSPVTGTIAGVKSAATSAQGLGALVLPDLIPAPTDEANTAAARGAGEFAAATPVIAGAGTAVRKAIEAIPNAARAGGKFNAINMIAKDVPIDTTVADDVIARAEELRQRGSAMPKVMRDFVKNRQSGVPMTYAEGRDFGSNASAMSARDITRTTAKMQGQVNQFAQAMKEANRGAAESVGMGDLYDSAMKEYSQAKTLAARVDTLKKWGIRAAAVAALGAAGAKGVDLYRGLSK